MAELDFDPFSSGAQAPRSVQLSQMINLAGAACSVALVVGLGLWGYKLAVRDVQGVPVIRALTGPMREMPQQPGGDVASHQGLSVNAVAAVGMAAAMPEQVLLAPAPVTLAPEDAAGLGLADPVQMPQVEVGTSDINPTDLSIAADDAMAEIPQDLGTDAAVALALADALAEGVEPFADLPAAEPSVSALRPKPRPTQASAQTPPDQTPFDQSGADLSTSTKSMPAPSEIDPATLEVGTRLAQLGAFDDDAGARVEWTRLQAQFSDLFADKSLVIQAAQSGGDTFYRLRAHGFADEDAARQFCAALVAENTPCIPAQHR